MIHMPGWYEEASENAKISIQAFEIYLILKELKARLSFSLLRLMHAIRFTRCPKLRAELKLQKRILDEHMHQIETVQRANIALRGKNAEQWANEESE